MPDVKLLPSPRPDPFAGQNAKAFENIMQILGEGETARREKIQTQNILEAISRGEGREGISSAAMMEPGFSGGIPGGIQRFASLFAPKTPGRFESLIAGKGIETAFPTEYEQARTAYWKQGRTKTDEEELTFWQKSLNEARGKNWYVGMPAGDEAGEALALKELDVARKKIIAKRPKKIEAKKPVQLKIGPESYVGQEAKLPNGQVYGIFVENPEDPGNPLVEMNEEGLIWLLQRANGDKEEVRRIAKKEGYVIPK